MRRKEIIRHLKELREYLSEFSEHISSVDSEITTLIQELTDESRTGSFAEYDFGKEKLAKLIDKFSDKVEELSENAKQKGDVAQKVMDKEHKRSKRKMSDEVED